MFDKLDHLVGGALLAAPAVVLAGPLGAVTALWGWIHQKNEATALVRTLLDKATNRLLGTGGYQRHQLLAAAHTTIVLSSYFDAGARDAGSREGAAG